MGKNYVFYIEITISSPKENINLMHVITVQKS